MKRTTLNNNSSRVLCVLQSLAGLLLLLAVIPDHGGKRTLTDKQAAPSPQESGFRNMGRNSIQDNWIVARYLSDRAVATSPGEKSSSQWENVFLDTIYKVHNSIVNPMGLAGYLAVTGGNELVNREDKLLIPQVISKWIAVWNGTFESEGTNNSLVEQNEPLEEPADSRDAYPASVKSHLYLGPHAQHRTSRWYVSVSPSIQLTHDDRSPDFSTRVILGIAL